MTFHTNKMLSLHNDGGPRADPIAGYHPHRYSQDQFQEETREPEENPRRRGKSMRDRRCSSEAATLSATPTSILPFRVSSNHIQFSEVTKITRSRVEAAETRVHSRVIRLTLCEELQTLAIEPVLFWFNSECLRWFRHVLKMPTRWTWAVSGMSHWMENLGTCWSGYISQLAWKYLKR